MWLPIQAGSAWSALAQFPREDCAGDLGDSSMTRVERCPNEYSAAHVGDLVCGVGDRCHRVANVCSDQLAMTRP